MDGGAWWTAFHGVAKSWTRLSDFIFTFMHWRRKWQPTQVLLPGKFYGWRSRRINAFEPWCWRRLLRVPWTARRSNQSFLKEISPEYLSEGLMLRLKLQSFGHLMRRTDSLAKTLMLTKIEGKRRRGQVGWHHQPNRHESE